MIIIFEGMDASGKDTLRRAFEKKTKYEHTVVTRFFFSQIVYARYYERPEWTNPAKRTALLETTKKFLRIFKPIVVYCTADVTTLSTRIQRRGESLRAQPDPLVVRDLYRDTFMRFSFPVGGARILRVSTSFDPPMKDLVGAVEDVVAMAVSERRRSVLRSRR